MDWKEYVTEAGKTTAEIEELNGKKLTFMLAKLDSIMEDGLLVDQLIKKPMFMGKEFDHEKLQEKRKGLPKTPDLSFISSYAHKRLAHSIVGMYTELGELIEAYFKSLQGEEDLTNIIEEFGGIFWYIAEGTSALGLSWEEIWKVNTAQLRARHGDTFKSDWKKDEDKERSVMTNVLSEMKE